MDDPTDIQVRVSGIDRLRVFETKQLPQLSHDSLSNLAENRIVISSMKRLVAVKPSFPITSDILDSVLDVNTAAMKRFVIGMKPVLCPSRGCVHNVVEVDITGVERLVIGVKYSVAHPAAISISLLALRSQESRA